MKYVLIGLGSLLVITGLVLWLVKPFSSSDKEDLKVVSNKTSQKTARINEMPIEKRPFFILEPKSSVEPKSLGHWVTFTIDNTDGFSKMEYEFEYTTGFVIQGAMGKVDFISEKPPVSKEIAFGSASKGKYRYDEGVQSGSFLLTLTNGDEAVLKTEFNQQKMTDVDGVFTTPDGKAELNAGSKDLSANDYLIVANTLGLPKAVSGEFVAGPCGFYADGPRTLSGSEIVFNDAPENSRILFWSGAAWEELKTTVSNGQAVAIADSLGTFVLIKD